MIKINKVTTKTGDKGQTLGVNCQMLSKGSLEVEFLGKLDDLNCALGAVLIEFSRFSKVRKIIEKIQHQIFDVGSMFYRNSAKNCDALIEWLEREIDYHNRDLPELDSFLLPGKNNLVVSLHQARCSARNAERVFWKFLEEQADGKKSDTKIKTENLNNIGIYLNRLSDFIFVIIRRKSKKKWIPTQFSSKG